MGACAVAILSVFSNRYQPILYLHHTHFRPRMFYLVLGVSNYGVHHLKELLGSNPTIRPVVNQIEVSPGKIQLKRALAGEISLYSHKEQNKEVKLRLTHWQRYSCWIIGPPMADASGNRFVL